MNEQSVLLSGKIIFKLRFNTTHGDTNLYWRVIIGDTEHLVTTLQCNVSTHSDASYDERAGMIKYHIAGECSEFSIDENGNAFLN